MLIYRFKVTCEEHDSFLREIEIQPNQTFLDFHHILLESAELLHCEQASFFMTDKRYKKDKEISLKTGKRQVRKYDEDLDQVVTESITVPLMKTEKLKDYIEDPHQKMIYEFAGRDTFSFHIELFKIFPADLGISFPRCIKRIAELPKKAEQPVAAVSSSPHPKVSVPKIPLPKVEELLKFDDIVEDELELAAIEGEIGELMGETLDDSAAVEDVHDEHENADFLYGGQHESDEEEPLDHLDDYEDIENLDQRLSGFDRESDDY